MNIVFLTFGGEGEIYYHCVKRICEQAKQFDIFTKIIGYTDFDLKNDEIFWKKNKDFIENNSRGYGFWIWKPYIILKTLNMMNENDLLLYLDCGCELNIKAKNVFFEYIKLLETNDIIGTHASSTDITYTKSDLVHHLNMDNDNDLLNKLHMQAGIVFMKKTPNIMKLYTDFYDIAISNNYHYIDDSPSIIKNNDSFIEHRHDQSIFNLLVKKYGLHNYLLDPVPNSIDELSNKTWFEYPIFCIRNKTKNSMIDQQ
ncbi:hypothetical protein BMW23_0558 [Bodo saltans virus]|uniref:Uncharacterized protein n=1 Tax=Bodo saltans virus TaxID=2024608 RepID=A0A2H4UUV2_9VIRU|nr:hypothetical protein QJ851_gp0542 [Bodo saltans virus]ATZ80605.1 hypothetical protein BMW23_0558 [Bodo saltans virus]